MSASSPPPPLLRPEPGGATLRTAPWGGRRLGPLRGGSAVAGQTIGESWEFSTLPGAHSRAMGRPLNEVLGGPLPFLAKLIDTARPLSIQVHPADDPSRTVRGKEEAWVILDAAPGASVLAGVRPEITARQLDDAMRTAIATPDRGAALVAMLETIPVRRGMVLVIPAGTVHAVGGDILLAEIQQPVDCTFRLFDYGSERPLHPDAAAAHWWLGARPVVWHPETPPRQLRGEHLSLDPIGPGTTTLPAPTTPRLLTAVGGGVRVSVDDPHRPCVVELAHGDLALHIRGPARIDVSDTALLITGWIHRRAWYEDPSPGSDAAGTTTSAS